MILTNLCLDVLQPLVGTYLCIGCYMLYVLLVLLPILDRRFLDNGGLAAFAADYSCEEETSGSDAQPVNFPRLEQSVSFFCALS
jgi:hypothetical protein